MDNNAMRPVKESDGKWGYEDKCHREIIPPVYKAAMPMYDGICWVKRLNWGAIDSDETTIVPFIYQSVYRISPQTYMVRSLGGKFGLIDHCGNVILDAVYDSIIRDVCAENILVLICDGRVEYANFLGEKLFEDLNVENVLPFNSCVQVSSDSGEYIYFNKDKRIKVPDSLFIDGCNEKFAILSGYEDDKKHLSVYDTEGQLVFSYADAEDNNLYNDPLCDDTCVIKTGKGLLLHNLIDHNEVVVDGICDFKKLDNRHMTVVSVGKKFGVIDVDGRIVVPCVYDGIGTGFGNEKIYADYYNGRYIAASSDGEKCGIIDFDQNVIIPFEYTSIKMVDEDGDLLVVKQNGKYGVITIDNRVLVDLKYDYISKYNKGVAIAHMGKKVGAIDIRGNVIVPFAYDEIDDYGELERGGDYMIARAGNIYTVFDVFGNITFESKEKKLKKFYNGFLEFYETKSLTGFCDVFGNEIIPYGLLIDIPVVKRGLSVEADIDAIKNKCHSDPYGNVLAEFNGYYIYSVAEADYPIDCTSVSYIVNPERKIIFTSLYSTVSIAGEDQNNIYLKYNNPDYSRQRIIIDKRSHDLQKILHHVDSEMLSIIDKNGQFGLLHEDLGLVTAIEYDKVQIVKNIALAIKGNDLFVLLDGHLPIKEIKIDNSYGCEYNLRVISNDFTGLYYNNLAMCIFSKNGICYEITL